MWADALCRDGGGSSVFLAAWVVFAQNSSQLLPLLHMKLVISLKAWYVTVCTGGVRGVWQWQFEVSVMVVVEVGKVGLGVCVCFL